MSFEDLKVGDKVQRMLGGDKKFHVMTVMAIDGNELVCAAPGTEGWPLNELWRFDRSTGVEEDHELGWGVKFGVTGTYLKRMEKTDEKATDGRAEAEEASKGIFPH